jgi:hypothetical protein
VTKTQTLVSRCKHGYHRLKARAVPALPLRVRVPERIVGLLVLLLALQVLTLLELVAQRSLATRQEAIAGLVPGNPKMMTARPSAERLLAAFPTCTVWQIGLRSKRVTWHWGPRGQSVRRVRRGSPCGCSPGSGRRRYLELLRRYVMRTSLCQVTPFEI